MLARGVTWRDGVIPELVPFVDKAGLTEARATVARLRDERTEWGARVANWDLVGTYRLRPGKRHNQNGLRVFPGETVQLTGSQFYAFRDKFEPVAAS